MKRFPLFTALAFALGLTAGGAAIAQTSEKTRLIENGMRFNGIVINGSYFNGLTLNGITLQGYRLNGHRRNGVEMNGRRLNGADIQNATVNPFSGLDRAPLGQ